MGSTIIEKILARASGKSRVRPGEIAVCRPDMVIQIDQLLSVDGMWYRPKKVFDPDRIAVIFDHCVPAPTIKDAAGMTEGRRFVKEFGIKALVDVGSNGIAHVVAAEKGLARPGELLVCADSHTCAAGALNCAGRGTGAIDTLQALVKGMVWFPVSPTIRYEFKGALARLVSGKDVFFHIAQTYGAQSNTTVEFGGAGLAALKMSDRRTIATMCAEISVEFALFEYDEVTERYLEGRFSQPATPVEADPDADYVDVRTIDLADVEPYVGLPPPSPGSLPTLEASRRSAASILSPEDSYMDLKRTGRVWLFGNGINTDQIFPTKAFGWPEKEQHRSCFEAIRPGWVDLVAPGDLIVAGDNFGIGSSRPIGAILRACGIAGVVANSLDGLGLRSLINYSVPALSCPGVIKLFQEGDRAEVDFCAGTVENLDRPLAIRTAPLAPELARIVAAGGVVPMLVAEGLIESEMFVASFA